MSTLFPNPNAPVDGSQRSKATKSLRSRFAPHAGRPPQLRICRDFESASQRRAVLEWLNSGLRPGRPGQLQREYPQIFASGSPARSITLFEGDRPLAHASLLPAAARCGPGRFRLAMISLVYTDPDARGRGCASRVLREARAVAEHLGLGLSLLWSDLTDFYQSQGFRRAGSEHLLVVDDAILQAALTAAQHQAGAATELIVQAGTEDDWHEIDAIRGQRESGIEIDGPRLTGRTRLPNLDIQVARRNEALVGFAMRGRGDDFEEVIHEWGGESEAALRCCQALLEMSQEPERQLFVLSPSRGEQTSWWLRQAGARIVRQPAAWMQISSRAALVEDLLPALPEIRELADAGLDDQTLLRALFGDVERHRVRAALEAVQTRLGQPPPATLPWPFFVWGLESI